MNHRVNTSESPGVGRLHCGAQIPVADLVRARHWYAEHLAIKPILESTDELHYGCAGETFFTLYRSTAGGSSDQTVMAWLTRNLDDLVRVLRDRGVRFETYDSADIATGPDGIARIGRDRVAWFKDADGNTLAVGTTGTGLLERLASPDH